MLHVFKKRVNFLLTYLWNEFWGVRSHVTADSLKVNGAVGSCRLQHQMVGVISE